MPLYDQHVHSRHSFDSEAEPASSVEIAIAKGLAGLTFAEHFDTHPGDWNGCVYDHEAYSDTIEHLRAEYGDRIFIGKGIEICYQRERMDFVLDFLTRHEFDMVMLSVHYFQGKAVYVRESWDQLDPAAGARRYLETVLEAARFCQKLHRQEGRVFDVLGHLDLAKRYAQRFFGTQDLPEFEPLFGEILRACIEAELVPEINTSTLRQGLAEPMPGTAVIAQYAASGGTAMLLGSDAHHCENVAADFDQAVAILRAAGIRQAVVFKRREPTEVPLDAGVSTRR